jgi:hypothetical protein
VQVCQGCMVVICYLAVVQCALVAVALHQCSLGGVRGAKWIDVMTPAGRVYRAAARQAHRHEVEVLYLGG